MSNNFGVLATVPDGATCVLAFSAPEFDYEQGTQYLEEKVCYADDDLNPVGEKSIKFDSKRDAEKFAERLAMAKSFDLEFDCLY